MVSVFSFRQSRTKLERTGDDSGGNHDCAHGDDHDDDDARSAGRRRRREGGVRERGLRRLSHAEGRGPDRERRPNLDELKPPFEAVQHQVECAAMPFADALSASRSGRGGVRRRSTQS
jgi:hypothetical protein